MTEKPKCPEFESKVNANIWHDVNELDEVIQTIKQLSAEDSGWSWALNTDCKYVDVRFDMRDGGFVILDREKNRINLEQLKWQYVTK